MAEISFSNKPEPKIITEDRNWIKPECAKCPYFVRDEENKIMQCVRPLDLDEECLVESPLVAGLLIKENYEKAMKILKDTPDREDIKHKKIYRRR